VAVSGGGSEGHARSGGEEAGIDRRAVGRGGSGSVLFWRNRLAPTESHNLDDDNGRYDQHDDDETGNRPRTTSSYRPDRSGGRSPRWVHRIIVGAESRQSFRSQGHGHGRGLRHRPAGYAPLPESRRPGSARSGDRIRSRPSDGVELAVGPLGDLDALEAGGGRSLLDSSCVRVEL